MEPHASPAMRITVLSGMVQQNFGMWEKARVSATISYFPLSDNDSRLGA